MTFNPEQGFTSDVITDPKRFVGRTSLLRQCVTLINQEHSLIAIYGMRGIGKSSLARQLQKIAEGDYTLLRSAGLEHLLPEQTRSYETVYYTCDSTIKDCAQLLTRLINDADPENGLARLVPDRGRAVVEIQKTSEFQGGLGSISPLALSGKTGEVEKWASPPSDVVQTFRNMVMLAAAEIKKGGKAGIFIVLDEFDVVHDKSAIGSLLKTLSGESVKFCVCGIAETLSELVADHASVQRLLGEDGAVKVAPMNIAESMTILNTAEKLYGGSLTIERSVKERVARASSGFPYMVQLLGRALVKIANERGATVLSGDMFAELQRRIASGEAIPTLEQRYKVAVHTSDQRKILLSLLADFALDKDVSGTDLRAVTLVEVRKDAKDLDVDNIDQVVPRLLDARYGPVLKKISNGTYVFVDPVFCLYVRLRNS